MDVGGKTLLSRRVANDEPELLKLIGDVLGLADGRKAAWAIDMTGGGSALMPALLVRYGQEVLYIPGRLVNRASDGYRGDRRPRCLRDRRPGQDAPRSAAHPPRRRTALELKLLTGRRAGLVEDRTRVVTACAAPS